MYKTKEVADHFSVSARTVQSWIKRFNLNIQHNASGHYQFSDQDIQSIEAALHDEKTLRTEKPARNDHGLEHTDRLEEKLEYVLIRLAHVERLVESKADEVVTFQLLKHRHDIEDLKKAVQVLESEMTVSRTENNGLMTLELKG
ncbi:chromosome-anchoring protein RacA [Salsuginibacillus halophilus]|uniref:Chromosome-anchoring protein RacA n=1 Tax=Salsuginibacillus halophilus TaxID=517424 RepID=A0A2P8HWI9_9BACI|nr:MerR family transcriptional regulator [Salsuginibacillus halophilus]PSL50544.1 chromosome-anchoring protein RacA [Salsuginibacillus halophilus]